MVVVATPAWSGRSIGGVGCCARRQSREPTGAGGGAEQGRRQGEMRLRLLSWPLSLSLSLSLSLCSSRVLWVEGEGGRVISRCFSALPFLGALWPSGTAVSPASFLLSPSISISSPSHSPPGPAISRETPRRLADSPPTDSTARGLSANFTNC
jgi:hypothetical protein